jgi:hypothetical protein
MRRKRCGDYEPRLVNLSRRINAALKKMDNASAFVEEAVEAELIRQSLIDPREVSVEPVG